MNLKNNESVLKVKIFHVDEFLEKINLNKTDLIEIHNRPNYIKKIRNKYQNKIFFYFHNDPLSMNGSKNIKERLFLINNIDKIFFNSKWSQQKIFSRSKNIS